MACLGSNLVRTDNAWVCAPLTLSLRYFEEQRLHNLVGSIHTWQPDARIVVYSLGLQDSVSLPSPALRLATDTARG